jgi:prepilin-type N-terminal cleavage/methylation domain-containing protein
MKKIPGACSQQGFTLLEVMIAVSILTIGILAVVSIQYSVVNGNTNGNVMTQELNLAQRVMEQQKAAANPTSLKASVLNNVDQNGDPGGPYNVKVSVTNPMGGTASRFVIVTVSRNGGIGGHELTLRSLTQGNGI